MSLSVSRGTSGRLLLHCQTEVCTFDQILAAVDLSPADMAPTERLELEVKTIYEYTDESGRVLSRKVRLPGKQFYQEAEGGSRSLVGVRRVLYRLPEIVAAARGSLVFVVEGERDVETLRALGLVATTNPEGAGKWRDEYTEALRGLQIAILPDNDQAGMKHAEKVMRALEGQTPAVLLALPRLEEKEDVTDWLDRRGGSKAELLNLVSALRQSSPIAPRIRLAAEIVDEIFEDAALPKIELGFSQLDRLTGGLRAHTMTTLVGVSGGGKTSFALQVAAYVSRRMPVVFAPLELTSGQVVGRLAAQRLGLAWGEILDGRADREAIHAAVENHLLWIVERRPSETLESYLAELDRVIRSAASAPGMPLLIVDYLQLAAEGEEARAGVMAAVRAIQALTEDRSRPVATLALSQGSRAANRRIREGADDPTQLIDVGAESGAIEHSSAQVLVLGIDPPGEGEDEGKGVIHLAKNRFGRTGQVGLTFTGSTGVFRELPEKPRRGGDDARRERILAALGVAGRPLGTREIAQVVGGRTQRVIETLRDLSQSGEVVREIQGRSHFYSARAEA